MAYSPPLVRIILHTAAVSVMTYGYISLRTLPVDAWMRNQHGGHSQFLTIQGLWIAWTTMIVSLVLDLFPSIAVFRTIKRALLIIALPLSVVVSSIYWTLLIFFPAAILRRIPNSSLGDAVPRLPLSIDLALHASPSFVLLVDFLLFETKYSKRMLANTPYIVSIFAIWYGSWVERCARGNNGIFPYPFLTDNPFKYRLVIYTGAAVLGYTAFWTINRLHGHVRR